MTSPTIQDHQWLASDEGRGWLNQLRGTTQTLLQRTKMLRKTLSPQRTHLLLEQLDLQARARVKFCQAERMLFTRQSLEQATDEVIAAFKAQRFPADRLLADFCCGIGGDLLSIARRGPTCAVDRDPVMQLYARANCQALQVPVQRVEVCDVRDQSWGEFAAWHLDPDRRPRGRRTTRVDDMEPPVEVVDRMLAACGDAAVKLAPASPVPDQWADTAERHWLGSRRECRQQLLWFGQLARHPGLHSATMFDSAGRPSRTLVGRPALPVDIAERIGLYVYEPAPVVLTSQLTGVLAAEHRLASLAVGVDYLTSDRVVNDCLLSGFAVQAIMPLDHRKLSRWLKQRAIGHVEVKKRGVEVDVAGLQRRYSSDDENSVTLLITRQRDEVRVVVGQRLHPDSSRAGDAAG